MKTISSFTIIIILATAIAGLGIACSKSSSEKPSGETQAAKQYTCPMHPEVVQAEPGKCPKCGMALKLK